MGNQDERERVGGNRADVNCKVEPTNTPPSRKEREEGAPTVPESFSTAIYVVVNVIVHFLVFGFRHVQISFTPTMEGVDILESTAYGVFGLEKYDCKAFAGKSFGISGLAKISI